jgi:hypothetical protein
VVQSRRPARVRLALSECRRRALERAPGRGVADPAQLRIERVQRAVQLAQAGEPRLDPRELARQ